MWNVIVHAAMLNIEDDHLLPVVLFASHQRQIHVSLSTERTICNSWRSHGLYLTSFRTLVTALSALNSVSVCSYFSIGVVAVYGMNLRCAQSHSKQNSQPKYFLIQKRWDREHFCSSLTATRHTDSEEYVTDYVAIVYILGNIYTSEISHTFN